MVETAREDVEVWIRTTDDARAAVVLRELLEVRSSEHDEGAHKVIVRVPVDCDLARVSAHLHARELGLRHLERRALTLEQAFMWLTKGLVG